MGSQRTQLTSERVQKVEARASVRYRFGVPARFWWAGQAGARLQGEGVTRDISVSGAYILTATYPPADVVVQLEIVLTPPDTTGHSVKIATEGQVLRIEHSAEGKARGGFAVASKGFEILVVGIEQA
jgi:hypothetical protein